jgi:mono/diheme cytochrome c family protein
MSRQVRTLRLSALIVVAGALVFISGTRLASEVRLKADATTQLSPVAAIQLRTDGTMPRRADVPSPVQLKPDATIATLNQYCVTCHNARLKTGGFVIDPAGVTNVDENAESWEKVVRKLRTSAMPPAGAPRPDAATYAGLAAFLESELDRAAAAHPQIGKLPLVHRLTRTEYQNAIRDLLGLEALPREMRVDYLLPADNISSGFDNIADLLFMSPVTLERYLDAATKISRFAVGDPAMPVLVNIHKIDEEQPQDERVDDLPFGTRGGVAVRADFPADASYAVKVELAGAPRDRHDLEVTVDGERAALRTLGAAGRGAPGAGTLEFPLPIKAGTRLIGVAFLTRTEARDEATLRPRMRGRGTQPAIASVTIAGPYDVSSPGESMSRRRIFTCRPASVSDELPCTRKILSTLARRAYRRPATDADLQDLLPFYEQGRAEGTFDAGIQKAIERLLVSSQFLFRIERQPATATKATAYRVSDLELASRLSFFLWSSIPDDELLDVAIGGRLKDPKILEQQVRRMLNDPRSKALTSNFAAQWLYLRDLLEKYPDEILFPDFDGTLREAMARETELFVDSVFRENRSVTDLLNANYTFLNERLAKHYGIPNVRGSYFRRVTLPDGNTRGGLLGQGSVLTLTSYSTRTSPVLRGKWVLENLLSSAPPPPPPNIPSLKTEGAGKPLTLRDAMTAHRANPSCATCHARMDPIGFAMENFDAIGKWRDLDAGKAIDTSGVFPDGTTFDGVGGLKRVLLRQSDQFLNTVAERLLMYAIGRNLQYYDQPSVRAIVRDASASNYTLPSLVMGVVKSRPFQMRVAD